MLKFVLIGVLILGALTFVMWNFWKMVLLKHKYYTESQTFLHFIEQFRDVPEKLKSIKRDKIIIWATAVLVSVLVLVMSASYFLIARNVFVNNHTHSYKDRVITNPTCALEGTLEYKCRYCDEKYEEPIVTIEHKFSETSRVDATCTKEGKIEYTCEMCADVKTESIPLKEHKYIETKEKEATCTKEGIMAKQCENCDSVIKENIPVGDEHSFKVASFKPSSFWKNGYNHYLCKDCGTVDFAPLVKTFNWIIIVSIVVLIITVIVIFSVKSYERYWSDTITRPAFWVSLVLAIISVVLLIFHFGVIIPHQKSNQPVLQKYSGAPIECELVETSRTESNYTENGTVVYKCKKCNVEYTEHLELKEIDVKKASVYSEPKIKEKNETESNSKIGRANEIALNTQMTGRLSSTKDVDFYKVKLSADGNITFKFTHEADEYSNHWYATIYDVDKTTVLSEGYIEKGKDEFGHSGLVAGTYYLKISAISGGNPLLNNYSNAKYHLMFTPECTAHLEKTQYLSKVPDCLDSVDIITVCNHCGRTVMTETKKIEHKWSEWEIIKPAAALSLGEKVRTCSICQVTEPGKDLTYWWVIPLLVLELILIIFGIKAMVKMPEKRCWYIILLLILSIFASDAILSHQIFNSRIWDGVALGIILGLNITFLVVFSFFIFEENSSKRRYIYEFTPFMLSFILALMAVLGFTVFSGFAIISVLVMSALAINGVVWSIIAHTDNEDSWMITNIVFSVISAALAVFFAFRI